MSPTIKTTYSRQEIRENREAFRDWKWTAGAVEPDGRVTVLAPAHHAQEMRGFLCRCQHGWFWVVNAAELAEKAERETPYSWNAATRDLGGDAMRVPTEQELDMGGFRITVDPEPAAFGRTFTTTELEALEDEFDHRVWRAESEEPDARVTVLYDEADRGVARWLVRVGTGWAWASPHGDPATPDPWDAIQRWMERSGHALRIPDRKELAAGGWTITSPEGDEEPVPDEAKEQIDAGFRSLDMMDLHGTGAPARRAQAHFMAAIAISLYDLVALHKKYDVDNMRVEVDPGPALPPQPGLDVSDEEINGLVDGEPENKPAPGALGSEEFPWAR